MTKKTKTIKKDNKNLNVLHKATIYIDDYKTVFLIGVLNKHYVLGKQCQHCNDIHIIQDSIDWDASKNNIIDYINSILPLIKNMDEG